MTAILRVQWFDQGSDTSPVVLILLIQGKCMYWYKRLSVSNHFECIDAGVFAYAACCNMAGSSTCHVRQSRAGALHQGAESTITCHQGETLVGCSVFSEDGKTAGAVARGGSYNFNHVICPFFYLSDKMFVGRITYRTVRSRIFKLRMNVP